MQRSILLALAWLPLAWAQTDVVTASQSAAPEDHHIGLIEKVMGIVTPTESGPMTETKRFHLYVLSVGGPVPLLGEAVGAGLSQWEDSPKEWGQGWNAYGKRFGSNLAYNGVRQTITYGTSILFHEDNRYFASHKHGVWARTAYAVRRTVTAQHPDGREVFSVSSVTGVLGASAIASIWGPSSWQGADGIARNAGISFATTAAFNVVREFLPDILQRPHK